MGYFFGHAIPDPLRTAEISIKIDDVEPNRLTTDGIQEHISDTKNDISRVPKVSVPMMSIESFWKSNQK